MLLLFTLLPSLILAGSSTQSVYYVKPDNSSHLNCPDQPCLTLDQYVEESSSYFTTGSMFLFLFGNHALQNDLFLVNLSFVSLIGHDENANVILYNRGSFTMSNVTSISIKGLSFYFHGTYHAIIFIESNEIVISNLTLLGSDQSSGSVIYSYSCSNVTIEYCMFERHMPGISVVHLTKSRVILTGNHFIKNKNVAIYAESGTAVFMTGNVFSGNTGSSGGAVFIDGSTINLFGNNFSDNEARLGGAVYINDSTANLFRNRFSRNIAHYCGGAIYLSKSTLRLGPNEEHLSASCYPDANTLQQNLTCEMEFFSKNAAVSGGAIFLLESTAFFGVASILITENRATSGNGGGMGVFKSSIVSVAEHLSLVSNIAVEEENIFPFQQQRMGRGGGIYSFESNITFSGNTLFHGNRASTGGAIHIIFGEMMIFGSTTLAYNAASRSGGALYLMHSNITVEDTVKCLSNSALHNGGVMYLEDEVYLTLSSHAKLNMSFNSASWYGGAIYHEDHMTSEQCYSSDIDTYNIFPLCFLQLRAYTHKSTISITSFYDSAGKSGSFLYGGLLDRCRLSSLNLQHDEPLFFLLNSSIINITLQNNTVTSITSDTFKLCLCDSEYCSQDDARKKLYPGQQFTLALMGIGQANTASPAQVTGRTSNTARLHLLQSYQYIPNRCTNLTYTLYSTQSTEELVLYPSSQCYDTDVTKVVVEIEILPCPPAFVLSDEECVCEERLREHNVDCIIGKSNNFITHKAGSRLWMNATYKFGQYEGLILYNPCPIGYCKMGNFSFTLDNPDMQCANNRSGVLCGACATNHSLLLGTSRCAICSNSYLALLLPFALAGIALVCFLTFLRLTVATGMINSLILYANIIQANKMIVFPTNDVNILTVFIAWLNLDFGFESCFFDGMDAYAQTWLQFAFPFYVWTLISVIIISSRYSLTLSKMIGSNPVAVLATLFLVSYSKILRVIIDVYSFVKLDCPQNSDVISMDLWLKDPNVNIIESGKILFISIVILLPIGYIVCLLLIGYRLYRFSGLRLFFWLPRMKPLLECYYAPYNLRTRYWPGFLLLLRCVLYGIFAYSSIDRNINLLAINLSFTGLGLIAWLYGRLYKEYITDLIEYSVYLNLIILSAVHLADCGHKMAVTYALVGIVFATAMGIIIFHFHIQYTSKSRVWLAFKTKILHLKSKLVKSPVSVQNEPSCAIVSGQQTSKVSKTVIELREPLLEN